MIVDTQSEREAQERLVSATRVISTKDYRAREYSWGEDPRYKVHYLFSWIDATFISHSGTIVNTGVVQKNGEYE